MDANQIYQLIDSVLPFEVCLYHQILPLSCVDNHLQLGMVNPQDKTALEYVHRILSSLKYSLQTQSISAEFHQSTLSAYLSSKGQRPEQTQGNKKVGASASEIPKVTQQIAAKMQAAKIAQPAGKNANPPTSEQSVAASANRPIGDLPPANLPVLKLNAYYLSNPVQNLASLPPQQLLQELLARVLLEGIGRLYFERQPEMGRVLWSQEGVLQSVLENLPPTLFQALVMELKRFFNLSFIPVEQPKQVEIERLYNKTHLLLILQLMPGEYGEEATLQVLRGAALKFYQQQKLADLSLDALKLAQQLQRKLGEIGENYDPNLNSGSLEALPALTQLLRSVAQQLQALKTMQSDDKSP